MLGWPLLKTIRKRNKCILVFKCLHDLVPKYLSEYYIRNSNVHSYNTRRCNDIHPPKLKLSLGNILEHCYLIPYLKGLKHLPL